MPCHHVVHKIRKIDPLYPLYKGLLATYRWQVLGVNLQWTIIPTRSSSNIQFSTETRFGLTTKPLNFFPSSIFNQEKTVDLITGLQWTHLTTVASNSLGRASIKWPLWGNSFYRTLIILFLRRKSLYCIIKMNPGMIQFRKGASLYQRLR